MSCQKCGSDRMMSVGGKTSDMCCVTYKDMDRNDYVPRGLNIGGGDYLSFRVCLDCGTMKGQWPLSDEAVEEALT